MTTGRRYNAAADLLESNLHQGRGGKVAVIDDGGSYTYDDLARRVHRAANGFRARGFAPRDRLLLCLLDTVDFPTCFLGAIQAGIIPVPLSTMATATDYAWILKDSQAKGAVVADARMPVFQEAIALAAWSGIVIKTGERDIDDGNLCALLSGSDCEQRISPTADVDPCFWLYSSGSTGSPKGTIHRHRSLRDTAELFGRQTLRITEDDVVYSAAKLFFAYGLGNSLSFPLFAGATSLLVAARPLPQIVNDVLRSRRPTVFCGVPTLFASLLADQGLPGPGEHRLRMCTSAGEALPEAIGVRWRARTGVDIIDGIGSTEMLHIFLSNTPDRVRYGTTGRPVNGYRVRLVDERGEDVPAGMPGDLLVSGPSAAAGYWNQPEKTRATFDGEWVRTGDTFLENADGDYVYCGRCDDMLKVSGLWVAPTEVEAALVAHAAVLEAAVVGVDDPHGLTKPKAFVVLKPGTGATTAMERELQEFVKARLAPHKHPRWIEFVQALPKTATGKIQRYRLRAGPG